MLTEAGETAATSGRNDLADYLRLKATNDMVRAGGVKWLLDTFVETAFATNTPTLLVERHEGHTFPHGTATMAGTLLTISLGVRCLRIEAGWARTPSHGFMRGQALARANILHFGRKRHDEELKLIRGEGLPEWVDVSGNVFRLENAERHVRLVHAD